VIRVRCLSCGKTFTAPEAKAGQTVPCSICHQPVEVENNSAFAEFAAPAPTKDPRAALRQLDEEIERERQMHIFLALCFLGTVLGAGTAVVLQPSVDSPFLVYLGTLIGCGLAGGLLPGVTHVLASGGGKVMRGASAVLPTIKDPAALMRAVMWLSALGCVCGSAAGAATGAIYGRENVETIAYLGPAYLGAVAGVLPALMWRWRAGKKAENPKPR
jgi:hypothetical protein